MTVLPNRPSDGNSHPTLGADGAAWTDPLWSSSNVPPTLFKLPNLGVRRRITETNTEVADPHDAAPRDADLNAGSGIGLRSGRVNVDSRGDRVEQSFYATDDAAAVVGSASVDTDTVRVPVATSNHSESILRSAVPETPAGRSWMDSLGSHGIVIVLLLIVVAAALLTGQGEEDPAVSSLTTQSELLNFDELSMDLPLPASDGDVKVAQSDVVPPAEPVAEFRDRPLIDELAHDDPSIAAQPEPTPATESTITFPDQHPAVEQSQSVVSLSEPQPQVGTQLTITNPASQSRDAAGLQYNSFAAPSSGIVALPAGNRVEVNQYTANIDTSNQDAANQGTKNQVAANPTGQDTSLLPSLEELAGLHDKPGAAAAPLSSSAPIRVMTTTPVGISNWSKYLPAISSEPGPAPDSSTSPSTQP